MQRGGWLQIGLPVRSKLKINSPRAISQSISPNYLKTKTIPGFLEEKGLCTTIRESTYCSPNCSLVPPFPNLEHRNNFTDPPDNMLTLGLASMHE